MIKNTIMSLTVVLCATAFTATAMAQKTGMCAQVITRMFNPATNQYKMANNSCVANQLSAQGFHKVSMNEKAPVVKASPVLIETKLSVGFAPPEYRGSFSSQFLADGRVLCIDNHGVTVEVARISKAIIEKAAQLVEGLKEEKLEGQDGPPCMDAPSTTVKVIQNSGQEVKIKTVYGCIEKRDYSATQLINLAASATTLCNMSR